MSKNILVAGDAGYIGSHTCKQLAKKATEILGFSTKYSSLNNIIKTAYNWHLKKQNL